MYGVRVCVWGVCVGLVPRFPGLRLCSEFLDFLVSTSCTIRTITVVSDLRKHKHVPAAGPWKRHVTVTVTHTLTSLSASGNQTTCSIHCYLSPLFDLRGRTNSLVHRQIAAQSTQQPTVSHATSHNEPRTHIRCAGIALAPPLLSSHLFHHFSIPLLNSQCPFAVKTTS